MNSGETSSRSQIQEGADFLAGFLDHTKCPPSGVKNITCVPGDGPRGFFQFSGLQLFGRSNGLPGKQTASESRTGFDSLYSGREDLALPFDLTEIMENLRREKYVGAASAQISYITNSQSLPRRMYYAIRPLMPVRVRRHLQRLALQNWSKITFPNWPVDTTVEDLIERVWILALKSSATNQIPFIWYWPDSHRSCAIMTHDVETAVGQDFCPRMLEIEREYGIPSSFEVVPEVRYEVSEKVLEAIRKAGCEVCVHGLNHDGRLFSSEELFRFRAKAINEYARKWGATGFRSPVMYRNLDWYDAFELSYDMSVPNVAHLDPQRGGCCTVFPYFVGGILELPLTTTQDYPLYNIIRSNPMEMWLKQTETIVAKNGLVSFIIHPDYTIEKEKQALYGELLKMLRSFADERNMWLALPGEVDNWWRERAAMRLEQEGGNWVIRGKGAERATLAYATLENGKLKYLLAHEPAELSARNTN